MKKLMIGIMMTFAGINFACNAEEEDFLVPDYHNDLMEKLDSEDYMYTLTLEELMQIEVADL